jgi:hypothetical protein
VHAAITALASIPDKRWLLWLYERLPGAGTICEAAYGVIARHRSFAFEVTRLLWGIPVRPEAYNVTWHGSLREVPRLYRSET